MSGRARLFLWLSLTLIAFIAIGLLVRRGAEFDFTRDHASTRANPWGTKAWRELLERSGIETRTWLTPLTELHDEVCMLVLLDPVLPIDKSERDALVRWVESGGTLIIAPHAYRNAGQLPGRAEWESIDEALAAFGLHAAGGNAAEVTVAPRAEEPVTADVEGIFVPTDYRLHGMHAPITMIERAVLLEDADGAVAVRVQMGEGTVIALCEASILSNANLRRADNVIFAANLVFAHGTTDIVYFDEYHNAVVEREEPSEPPEVDVSPVRNTALALLAIAALYALGRAKRFGSVVEDSDAEVRTGDEYVRAFAEIYSRADASGAAARMLAEGLRRRASHAAGVPVGAATEVLTTALQRRGLPGSDIVALLEELEAAEKDPPNDRELLTLAQNVARYEVML